jgi:hypothetical protein
VPPILSPDVASVNADTGLEIESAPDFRRRAAATRRSEFFSLAKPQRQAEHP